MRDQATRMDWAASSPNFTSQVTRYMRIIFFFCVKVEFWCKQKLYVVVRPAYAFSVLPTFRPWYILQLQTHSSSCFRESWTAASLVRTNYLCARSIHTVLTSRRTLRAFVSGRAVCRFWFGGDQTWLDVGAHFAAFIDACGSRVTFWGRWLVEKKEEITA